jgi:hypothetical protein
MEKKLTEELLNELMFARSIDEVLEKDFIDMNISDYLEDLLIQKNLKKSDVIKNSNLNMTFAYQIFSGQRQGSRNKIIQLVFALKATLTEAQRILKLSGANELYSRNRRDAILIFCLNNKKPLEETNDLLFEYGELLLWDE